MKDKSYFVIDNLLTQKEMDDVENLLHHFEFPVYMTKNYSTVSENLIDEFKDHKKVKDYLQYVHTMYDYDEEKDETLVASQYHQTATDVLNKLMTHFKVSTYKMLRAKANFQPQYKYAKPGTFNVPHVDVPLKHTVVIYYVNDSDGETFLFKDKEAKKIMTRISPKKGRFLVFDGGLTHAGSHPYESKLRTVINYDIGDIR